MRAWLLAAHTGPLAEGLDGVPYGPADVLAQPPSHRCRRAPEGYGDGWLCDRSVGGMDVTVLYNVQGRWFIGARIAPAAPAAPGDCDALLAALQAHYGAGLRPVRHFSTQNNDL